MNLSLVTNIFRIRDYRPDILQLKEAIRSKIAELGLSDVVVEDSEGERIARMKGLTFISLTPQQYHKKVMLFTLPQFLISIYASLYSSRRVLSWEYLYHSHHVYSVLASSLIYWGNYDSEDENVRKFLRRMDMICVLLSTSSLYWRANKYSKGLTKATFFANIIFGCLFLLSHYFNKWYPYRSIWSHSIAHTMTHVYNVHYFMTVYRIKVWKRSRRLKLPS